MIQYVPIAVAPRELDYLAWREVLRAEIIALFGIPSWMLVPRR